MKTPVNGPPCDQTPLCRCGKGTGSQPNATKSERYGSGAPDRNRQQRVCHIQHVYGSFRRAAPLFRPSEIAKAIPKHLPPCSTGHGFHGFPCILRGHCKILRQQIPDLCDPGFRSIAPVVIHNKVTAKRHGGAWAVEPLTPVAAPTGKRRDCSSPAQLAN